MTGEAVIFTALPYEHGKTFRRYARGCGTDAETLAADAPLGLSSIVFEELGCSALGIGFGVDLLTASP